MPSFSAALLLLAGLGSCSSSPWYDHRFIPAPIETAISADGTAGAQVRALVTVIGIQKAQEGHPDRAVIRVRLENIGTVPAAFVPEAASLLTADLNAFGPAEPAAPGTPNEIPPGSNGQYELGFVTPGGKKPRELDLSGLNLRLTVAFEGKRVTTGMTFSRTDYGYYDSSPVHVGIGVGWTSVH
jgi:hypothetical protein